MSLINDALKRAQEVQRPNNSPSVAALPSVETRPAKRSLFSRMLVVVIFLLLAATFAFVGLAMTGRLAKKNVAVGQITAPAHPVETVAAPVETVPAPVVTVAPVAPEPPVPAPEPTVAPAVAPAPAPEPAPTPALVALAPTPAPTPATAPAPVPAPAAATVAPPASPLVLPESLHVQGIAHSAVRPWAIVSGRTVYVGDTVRGVQVAEITADSVTFSSHGQTNFLFLGQ
jgi:hypothetical protein